MAIKRYLAMTAEEAAALRRFPENTAMLCCPFSGEESPAFPSALPVLTDRVPVDGLPAPQLLQQLRGMRPEAVLLDFQRPGSTAAAEFARALIWELPCPVAVSHLYAPELACPVFLPPLPPDRRLRDHIAPWQGREVWLDLSTEAARIHITEAGYSFSPLPRFPVPDTGHWDRALHCHYSICLTEEKADFTLWRTGQDLEDLLQEAEALGVTTAVGLYQELNGL